MWLFSDTIPQPTTLLCTDPVIFTLPPSVPSIGSVHVEMRLQLLSLLQEQFSVSLISHGVDFHGNKKPTERGRVRAAAYTCKLRAVDRLRRLNKSASANDSQSSKIDRVKMSARVELSIIIRSIKLSHSVWSHSVKLDLNIVIFFGTPQQRPFWEYFLFF
jgi:hypothetical protein